MLDLVCHVNFVQQRFVFLVFSNGATVTPFFFRCGLSLLKFYFVITDRQSQDRQESDPICQAFLRANLPEQCHIIPD